MGCGWEVKLRKVVKYSSIGICLEDTCQSMGSRLPYLLTQQPRCAMQPGDHTVKWFNQAIVDLTSHLKGAELIKKSRATTKKTLANSTIYLYIYIYMFISNQQKFLRQRYELHQTCCRIGSSKYDLCEIHDGRFQLGSPRLTGPIIPIMK